MQYLAHEAFKKGLLMGRRRCRTTPPCLENFSYPLNTQDLTPRIRGRPGWYRSVCADTFGTRAGDTYIPLFRLATYFRGVVATVGHR